MKRISLLLIFCFFAILLCACGRFGEPISTTRPVPSYESNSEKSEDSENTGDTTDEPEPEPTTDVRDEPETIRQEISNMLRDAEDLISEGLYDDARMVLRDLRSRDLTDAEATKVNELLSKLVTISD